MKVFLSWSGEPSRELALALADWLPRVLQVVSPFVSAVDIDKGDTWVSKLQVELEATDFGIVCLTPTNLTSPWLHYEAGALGKSVNSRVCPVLLGVEKQAVQPPFRQLQLTSLEQDDVRLLVQSLNKASGETVLESRLGEAVDVWWPRLHERASKIDLSENRDSSPRGTEPSKPHLSDRELMDEVLQEVRSLRRTMRAGAGEVAPKRAVGVASRIRDVLAHLQALGFEIDPEAEASFSGDVIYVNLPNYKALLPEPYKESVSLIARMERTLVRVRKSTIETVTFTPDGEDDELPF